MSGWWWWCPCQGTDEARVRPADKPCKDCGQEPPLRCPRCSMLLGTGACRPCRWRAAPEDIRLLRQKGHAHFDRLWRSGRMGRSEAYRWLAGTLGVPEPEAHFGWMIDKALLERAISACDEYMGGSLADEEFADDGLEEALRTLGLTS